MNPIASQPRRTVRAVATVLLTLLAAMVLTPASSAAQPDPAPPTGWIRLGHLSPDTPAVDVYLAPLGGPSQVAIRKATYGSLTDYQSLTPGAYSVAMRPAGADEGTPAMLNWTVDVAGGTAATVLAVGTRDALTSKVITDDLAPPAQGNAKVRLIQGAPSEDRVDVTAVGGPTLARDVTYGAATGYAEVPGGRWNLTIAANAESAATVDVPPGSVLSLLVLDNPDGGLDIKAVIDGSGMPTMPAGGVETGAGGTAPTSSGAPVLGGLAALLVVVAVVLVRKRVTGRSRR